jgi:hypothetical protein
VKTSSRDGARKSIRDHVQLQAAILPVCQRGLIWLCVAIRFFSLGWSG